jgi:hypothetical protein
VALAATVVRTDADFTYSVPGHALVVLAAVAALGAVPAAGLPDRTTGTVRA